MAPSTAAELRSAIEKLGGRATYVRGKRKGQVRDLKGLRREYSRIKACGRTAARSRGVAPSGPRRIQPTPIPSGGRKPAAPSAGGRGNMPEFRGDRFLQNKIAELEARYKGRE